MPRGSRRHTWVVLVAGLAFPATAWGQVPGDKAAAQALFDEAIKLIGSRSYGEACPKLEESERLDPAMGTRFQLAQCYEAVGRTASAWAGFLELADLARAAGQEAREKTARQRAAEEEASTDRPVCRIQRAGVDTYPNLVRAGDGNRGVLQAQDVAGGAEVVEAKGSHLGRIGHLGLRCGARGSSDGRGDCGPDGQGISSATDFICIVSH